MAGRCGRLMTGAGLVAIVGAAAWLLGGCTREDALREAQQSMSFALLSGEQLNTLAKPRPPEYENAAPLYMQARSDKAFPTPERSLELHDFWYLEADKPGGVEAALAASRKLLGEFGGILGVMDEAASRPRCVFPWDMSRYWLAPKDDPWGDGLATLYWIRHLAFQEARASGRTEDAFHQVVGSLTLVRHLGETPLVSYYDGGIDLRRRAIDDLLSLFASGTPTKQDAVRALWALAEDGADAQALVRTQVILSHCAMEEFRAGRIDEVGLRQSVPYYYHSVDPDEPWAGRKPPTMRTEAEYLTLANRLVAAISEDVVFSLPRVERVKQDVRKARDNWLVSSHLLDHFYFLRRYWCDVARRRMASIALQLVLHRERTGALPALLRDIPEYDAGLKDPFSGQEFHYRKEPGGFTLWSVDYDGIDNGGRQKDEVGTEDDLVIRCVLTNVIPGT